jgi:hypothetical protein
MAINEVKHSSPNIWPYKTQTVYEI